MAFSGGVYTLPTPALVPGQIVSSSENNTVRNDMAASFNLTWLRNGTAAATANIPMGSFKLTGLGAATTSGDALSYGAAAVVTTLTSTSLTATRVPYAGTGGLLQDASTFTFDGTTLTAGGFTTSGAISAGTITASGAITVSGGTANGVAYLNGSKVLTTGSALTFDGANLGIGGTSFSWSRLLVRNGTNSNFGFTNSVTYGSNAIVAVNDAQAETAFGIGGSTIQFYTSAAEQMRLTSTGLGIGTSSPGDKLDVNGKSTFRDNLRLPNTNYIYSYAGGTATTVRSGFYLDGTNNVLSLWTNDTERLRLDSSGNLGLGVTPSAWGGNFKPIQIGSNRGCFIAAQNGYAQVFVGANSYYNGTNWIYSASDYASRYYQNNSSHVWETAPSGTAGNAISFTQAMTLDASGNLGIGTSSGSFRLNVADAGSATRVFIQNTANAAGGAGIYMQVTNGASVVTDNTIRSDNSGNMAFFTGTSSGTERMRIDSSGNVGIGTSSPNGKLHVYQDTTGTTSIRIQNPNTGGGANTALFLSGDSGEGSVFVSSAAGGDAMAVRADNNLSGGLYLDTFAAAPIILRTNATERMRIDSSGNLLVGTTALPSAAGGNYGCALIKLASGSSYTGRLIIGHGDSTGARLAAFYYGTTPTMIGSIDGSTTTVSYNTSSDYRLKENIQPMQNALDVVAQLNPVTYTWKADGSDGQGFIAHELQAVVPDCVTGEKDAVDAEGNPVYQGVDTSFLVATLTAAIKELKAELDATKAEVAALKGN